MCFPVKISKFYKKSPFLFWRTSANDCFWKAFLILGGVRRAVGKDLQVEFDASQSFDPDGGEWEGELHYKWYCRRKDEEFHERFELIPPKAPDAGCFRNGRYLLSEGYGGFQVVNEDQSIIIVSFTAKNSPVLGLSIAEFSLIRTGSLNYVFMNLFFCGMVDRRRVLSLNSCRDHCQISSPSRISDTPRAGFEPAQNLSSGFVEWSCAVVVTTTPRRKGKFGSEKTRILTYFTQCFASNTGITPNQ